MSKPSINQQLSEIDQLVSWFDSDQFAVEEAIERFEELVAKVSAATSQLELLENKITVLKQKFDQPSS